MALRQPHTRLTNSLTTEGLDERIHQLLDELDVDDVEALRKTGATIRQWVLQALSLRILNKKFAIIMKNLSKATLSFR